MLMGETNRRRTATQKLIQQFPECCFCGGVRSATTREHMPAKSLFDDSHRPDKLVMPACNTCNAATSTADLAVAMVSRWNYDSGPQEQLDHRKLALRVRKQAPELFAEWNETLDRTSARRHLLSHGVNVPPDAGLITIGPLTIRQLNLYAHKAVLALYFHHFRTPLTDTGRFCAFWRSKEDFARDGVPQEILNMLPDYSTLVQGEWNTRETFEYRSAMNVVSGLFACLARFRRGFFVFGIVAADSEVLPLEDDDWIKPSELLAMANTVRFQKRR
jgi:hypothetical protein